MTSTIERMIRTGVNAGIKGVAQVSAALRTRTDEHPYLVGIHAPMREELSLSAPRVSGQLPPALRRLVVESRPEIEALAAAVQDSAHTVLVGCGTAWNAALAGTYLFDELCGKEVAAIPASEFRYRPGAIGPETLVVAMSQSGETVDVIEATNIARANGARVAAIVR